MQVQPPGRVGNAWVPNEFTHTWNSALRIIPGDDFFFLLFRSKWCFYALANLNGINITIRVLSNLCFTLESIGVHLETRRRTLVNFKTPTKIIYRPILIEITKKLDKAW